MYTSEEYVLGSAMSMKIKRYADSTLKALTKDQLIEYIRELEHNWAAAEERCDNQYTLLQKLTKDMSGEELIKAQKESIK